MHENERDTVARSEHTPLYSWAPLIIGVGVFFMNAGFVFGIPVGIFGVLVLFAGVFVWVRQDVQLWAGGSHDDGGH